MSKRIISLKESFNNLSNQEINFLLNTTSQNKKNEYSAVSNFTTNPVLVKPCHNHKLITNHHGSITNIKISEDNGIFVKWNIIYSLLGNNKFIYNNFILSRNKSQELKFCYSLVSQAKYIKSNVYVGTFLHPSYIIQGINIKAYISKNISRKIKQDPTLEKKDIPGPLVTPYIQNGHTLSLIEIPVKNPPYIGLYYKHPHVSDTTLGYINKLWSQIMESYSELNIHHDKYLNKTANFKKLMTSFKITYNNEIIAQLSNEAKLALQSKKIEIKKYLIDKITEEKYQNLFLLNNAYTSLARSFTHYSLNSSINSDGKLAYNLASGQRIMSGEEMNTYLIKKLSEKYYFTTIKLDKEKMNNSYDETISHLNSLFEKKEQKYNLVNTVLKKAIFFKKLFYKSPR